MFAKDDPKVAVLESKLDIYEELSREMLSKLEQSMKSDELIIKMIDEMKEASEKNNQIIHGRIDRIQEDLKIFSKFRWQVGGVLIVTALLIGAGSRIAPIIWSEPTQVIQKSG